MNRISLVAFISIISLLAVVLVLILFLMSPSHIKSPVIIKIEQQNTSSEKSEKLIKDSRDDYAQQI